MQFREGLYSSRVSGKSTTKQTAPEVTVSRSINTSPHAKAVQELRRSGAAGPHKTRKHSPKGGRQGVKISLRTGREV